MPIAKTDITRDNLHCSLLKRVIVRADFSTMVDLDSFITNLNRQEWFKGTFDDFDRLAIDQVENDSDRTSVVNDSYGMLVNRFSGCQIGTERKVLLDIVADFVCLDIRCGEEYTRIDPYLSLVIKVLSFLIESDDYVKMKRLAIRKVNGREFEHIADADEVFEYFDQQVMQPDDLLNMRDYTERFFSVDKGVNVTYTRMFRVLDTGDKRFVFLLDIDTFLGGNRLDSLRPSKQELEEIFCDRLNQTLFELFKKGIKIEFLERNMKE